MTDEDVAARVERQRTMREIDMREPDPPVLGHIAEIQAEMAKPVSTDHFACGCGCPIATRVRAGVCPSCGRPFDLP